MATNNLQGTPVTLGSPSTRGIKGRFAQIERKLASYNRVDSSARHATSRLLLPLPIHQQESLQAGLARDALRLGKATGNVGSDGDLLIPRPEVLGPRIECTLSHLGVVQRTLVAFGGHWPNGTLVPGGPLISDVLTQRWSILPESLSQDACSEPCPRSSHAASVMGENRSLLIICGGAGESGGLLGDVKILEMRSTGGAVDAERRRSDRADRENAYEELSLLREHAAVLSRQLTAATKAAERATVVAEKQSLSAGSAMREVARKQAELQAEIERLRNSQQQISDKLARMFEMLQGCRLPYTTKSSMASSNSLSP